MAKKLRERAAEALEIPAEVAFGAPKLIIVGLGELKVINHQGVMVYQSDRILFRTSCGTVDIRGQGLELSQLSEEHLLITGQLEQIFLKEMEMEHEA